MAGTLKPARVRPSLQRLAWWMLPPLVLIGAWQLWDSVEANRLERALEPIRAGGPGPEPDLAAPETDSAARYYAAAAMAAAGRTRSSRIQIAPSARVVEVLTAMREAMSRGSDAPAPVMDAAAQQIRLDTVMLDLLDRGRALPFGRFAAGTEFNYRFSGLLEVNRLASLRTLESIRTGAIDVATKSLLDRVALLRAFDESQGEIAVASKALLVRDLSTDVGILVGASPSDENLRALSQALEPIYTDDDLERGIRMGILRGSEAVRFLIMTRRSIEVLLLRPWIRHQFTSQVRNAADDLERARRPWPERLDGTSTVDQRPIAGSASRFVRLWNASELTARMAEAVAAWRCARLAIQVEQFRQLRGGLPDTLAEVDVPASQDANDPFTGRSLAYIHEGNSYVVYSVGRDREDNRGASSDISVRVVSRRRSAPR